MKIKTNTNFIELKQDNLRGFTLHTNSKDIVIKRNNDYYIDTLIIDDKYTIKLGDKVEVDGLVYTVNIIQNIEDIFYCIQEPITKTSQFVFPMLGSKSIFFKFNTNFYNSYLSDCYSFIYLVYRFTNDTNYLNLEEQLIKHKNFIEVIDPSPELVVFKLKISKEDWNDVSLIMEGNYKDISTSNKMNICRFHNLDSTSKTYKTLYNSKVLKKEMEDKLNCEIPDDVNLISKPILKKELWTYQNVLKSSGIIN